MIIVNFLLRWLWRFLYGYRDKIVIHCSGWLPAQTGIKPCFKPITYKGAIKVSYTLGRQTHELYFCSFECLAGWLREAQRGAG